MGPEALIHKATNNPNGHTQNVGDPVVHVGAAIKGRLDEFNETAKGTRPHKYREQTKASGSRKREGERCKGDHVYQLVAAVGRRRLGVYGPQHGYCQDGCHNEGDRNIQVFAHYARLLVKGAKRNTWL